MGLLALIIAIIALILAYKAYTRSGGSIDEMRANINELGHSTEKVRKMAADALSKVEKSIRGDKDSQPDADTPTEGDSEEKQEQ